MADPRDRSCSPALSLRGLKHDSDLSAGKVAQVLRLMEGMHDHFRDRMKPLEEKLRHDYAESYGTRILRLKNRFRRLLDGMDRLETKIERMGYLQSHTRDQVLEHRLENLEALVQTMHTLNSDQMGKHDEQPHKRRRLIGKQPVGV